MRRRRQGFTTVNRNFFVSGSSPALPYFSSIFSGTGAILSSGFCSGTEGLEAGEHWHSAFSEGQIGFLNWTNIIVMLSQPSPPIVDGARHRSRTLSHTADSLFSCIEQTGKRMPFKNKISKGLSENLKLIVTEAGGV